MLTRRAMVRSAMAFSVLARLRPFAAAVLPQTLKEGAPDDETFWAYVRSEFELVPEFANLVSVVRGNFTKANREIAFDEATRLNQLPAPLFSAIWMKTIEDSQSQNGMQTPWTSMKSSELTPKASSTPSQTQLISYPGLASIGFKLGTSISPLDG